MSIEFFRHGLGAEEIREIERVFGALFLTCGPENERFERLFADYLGVKETATTSSATSAIHLGLRTLGIGEGDEVITTPLSFVASANAILMSGATPVFVDVDAGTALMDEARIEGAITPRTRAILPVHLYGAMIDIVRVRDIADRHGLLVFEDAAHAIEAKRDGVRPGTLGEAAAFSFYATKSITSGEGGALVTNDAEAAARVRLLRNHGMTRSAAQRHVGRYEHWDVEELGSKSNLTEIQAAMLIPQLARIEIGRQRREEISLRYEEAFTEAGVRFPELPFEPSADSRSARHLFSIWVEPSLRDETVWALQDRGIVVTVNYQPIHLTTFYRSFGYTEGDFPAAERIGASTISLPLYPSLSDSEVDQVIAAVVDVVSGQDADR